MPSKHCTGPHSLRSHKLLSSLGGKKRWCENAQGASLISILTFLWFQIKLMAKRGIYLASQQRFLLNLPTLPKMPFPTKSQCNCGFGKQHDINMENICCANQSHLPAVVRRQERDRFQPLSGTNAHSPFPMRSYFRPKHKDAKYFENHLNPIMLVFIG